MFDAVLKGLFTITAQYKPLLRPVKLAKQIVLLAAQHSKRAAESSWKKNLAKDLDLEIEDSDEQGEASAAYAGGGKVGGWRDGHDQPAEAATAAKLSRLVEELGAALLALNASTAEAGSLEPNSTSSGRSRGLVVGGREQLDDIRARLS